MMHELQVRGIASQRSQILRPARQGQERPAAEHAIGPIPAGLRPLGNQAVQRMLRSGAIQAKLVVNEPGDEYEREADRVAEQVMSMPEPAAPKQMQRACPGCEEEVQRQPEEEEEEEKVQTKPIAEQITPLAQRQEAPEEEEEPVQAWPDERAHWQEEPEEEEETAQTKGADGKAPQVGPGLEAQIRSLKGGGQPLPESELRFFEPRLGYDFSHVRLHTDGQAAKIVRELNARAFTVGSDIVLGSAQYAPETIEGREILAHELVHTIQQKNLSCSYPDSCAKSLSVQLQKKNPYSAPPMGFLSELDWIAKEAASKERLKKNPKLYDPDYIPTVETKFMREDYLYDFTISTFDMRKMKDCEFEARGCCRTVLKAPHLRVVYQERGEQSFNKKLFRSALSINIELSPATTTVFIPFEELKINTFNHELYHVLDAYRRLKLIKDQLSRDIQLRLLENRRLAAKKPTQRLSLLSSTTVENIIKAELIPYLDYFEIQEKEDRERAHETMDENKRPKMWEGLKMPPMPLKPMKGSFI